MNCNSKEVVYEERMYETQSVASISKIMTALIVLENASLNEMVTIDKDCVGIEGSSVYLKENEIYSIRSLLYALLLRSGNDAAYALAKYVGNGDVDVFVTKMNQKAKELGMLYTNFENPCGLEIPKGNISSSYDMSLLMCYAGQNSELMEILKCKKYTSNSNVWYNKNKLLSMNELVLGGKTGYTKKAGRTLVSIAGSENIKYAITTLHYDNDFEYHTTSYSKIFSDYSTYHILTKGRYYIDEYYVDVEDMEIISNNILNEKIQVFIDDEQLVIKCGMAVKTYPLYRR